MDLLLKFSDFVTGKSIIYKKENEIYDNLILKLDAIEINLNDILNNIDFLEENGINEKIIKDFKNLKLIISYEKKRLIDINDVKVKQENIEKIKKYEIQLLELIKLLKNEILNSSEIMDIYQKIQEINVIIYNNILLEGFKKFNFPNIIQKKWTHEELLQLRNDIYERKSKIIQYIIKYDVNKKTR